MKKVLIVFLLIIGFIGFVTAFGAGCATDPQVVSSQQALSEMTPLQQLHCAWFSCEEGPPEFDSQVEEAFLADLKNNDDVVPQPDSVEYDGDGTVSRVKICFKPTPFTNPAQWDCTRVGCGCALCQQRQCYLVKFFSAIPIIEVGGNCLKGTVAQDQQGYFYCDTGGGTQI